MLKKLISLSGLFYALTGFGQEWNTLNDLHFNGTINTGGHKRLRVHDSTLFLVGNFTTPYTGEQWSMVLKWDGVDFEQMGFPPNQPLLGSGYSFCEYDGQAFLGGSFTNLEGLPQADRIIRWDSTGFSEVGMGICGFTSRVEDMAVLGDKLYICGVLHDVGCIEDVFWGRTAVWDGNEWSTTGSSLDAEPYRLAVYNGELYAGGIFGGAKVGHNPSQQGWYATPHIAKLVNNVWTNLQGGCNGIVMDMMVDTVANELVLGGFFTSCGGEQTSLVARWDGTEFKPVGNLVPGNVYSVQMYRGQLYAGGWHVLPGVHLAYFDGYDWQPVPGAYFNGIVKDLEVYKDELYVAGSYSQFDGEAVPGIMRYYLHPDSVQWGTAPGVSELDRGSQKLLLFPNPVGDALSISLQWDQEFEGVLEIVDMQGRVVKTEGVRFTRFLTDINVKELKAGEYVVVLRSNGGTVFNGSFIKP